MEDEHLENDGESSNNDEEDVHMIEDNDGSLDESLQDEGDSSENDEIDELENVFSSRKAHRWQRLSEPSEPRLTWLTWTNKATDTFLIDGQSNFLQSCRRLALSQKLMSDSSSLYNKWKPEVDLSKGIESPIEILDDDVFFVILSFLNFADRIRIERVSHKWRKLSQQSWHKVNKFDFLYETWGIHPIHERNDDCCNSNLSYNDSGYSSKVFCNKVFKKVFALSANALTHCDININYKGKWPFVGSFILPGEAVSELFKSCKNLKYLKIGDFNWDNSPAMSVINLQTEKLEELHWEFISTSKVESVCLRNVLKKSSRLHTLEIEVGCIDPEQWEIIFNNDALKSLTIHQFFRHDTLKVVQYLAKLKNLELCAVDLRDMTDGQLKILVDNCKKLKSMLLKRTKITDEGLLQLTSLPDLQALKLRDSRLISDDNLHYFPNLKCLECSHTPFIKDDGVIKLLNSSQSLKKLELQRTGITIRCLEGANDAVKKRTNGLPLEIVVDNIVPDFVLENISPLLKIVAHQPILLNGIRVLI